MQKIAKAQHHFSQFKETTGLLRGSVPSAGANPERRLGLTCPVFLEEMTQTSAGFSMATMARAASSSFSQVRLKLIMYTPGGKNHIKWYGWVIWPKSSVLI